jgi:PTS system nitrogen regulatory IIA component
MPGLLADPFLALGITTSGIPFGGPRGALTDVFFLVGSVDEQGHLRTLARLSRLISLPEFTDQLRSCTDGQEAWERVRQGDVQLDS